MAMTPADQCEFMAAALREAGHPRIAAVAYETVGDNIGTGFQWERLGRCPSQQEVSAVVKAKRLLCEVMGGDFEVGPAYNDQYAKFWHFGLKHLRDLGLCPDEQYEEAR